ncbi:hypothetical protein [Streptomyces alboflavus]|uniref:hypothetical protein n=1 Tax=Streptomyces alboflavus TaxID=67267 RepID=UPI000F6566F2|nr:hypothetical protein [Streptomyces alboflavus]
MLIGALSAGLAISALAVVDAGQVGAQASTSNSAPPDVIWGAAPTVASGQGDVVWATTPAAGVA